MNVSLVLTSMNELQCAHTTTASDDDNQRKETVTGVSGSRKGLEVNGVHCDGTLCSSLRGGYCRYEAPGSRTIPLSRCWVEPTAVGEAVIGLKKLSGSFFLSRKWGTKIIVAFAIGECFQLRRIFSASTNTLKGKCELVLSNRWNGSVQTSKAVWSLSQWRSCLKY